MYGLGVANGSECFRAGRHFVAARWVATREVRLARH